MSLWFKTIKDLCGSYFSGVMLYHPPPKFVVKPHCGYLNPRLEMWPVPGFKNLELLNPGSGNEISKQTTNCSTIRKYCMCHKVITKLYLQRIYYICLNGWILSLTISLLKVLRTPTYFVCFMVTTYCSLYQKCFA